MIREIVGATTIGHLITGKRRRHKGMSTTMLGVVGTALGVGAYMAYKSLNQDNNMEQDTEDNE